MSEECEACGFVTEVKEYPMQGEPKKLCKLCAYTLAGNAARFPEQYPYRDLMMQINFVGNAIAHSLGVQIVIPEE